MYGRLDLTIQHLNSSIGDGLSDSITPISFRKACQAKAMYWCLIMADGFRVPNAAPGGTDSVIEIKGAQSVGEGALCVARYDETLEKQNN